MRVMLDTNVLISGMAFHGPERRLLDAILRNDHVLVLCQQTEIETETVLLRKFSASERFLENFLRLFRVERVSLPSRVDIEQARALIRDSKDAPILAAAIIAQPDIFVTGDKDFHTPEVKKLIPVQTASQALRSLKERDKEGSDG